MIDWGRIRDLRHDVGAGNFTEILDLFLQEADDLLRQLAQADDSAAQGDILHCLRGSALSLGFCDLVRLCSDPAIIAGAGPPDAAELRAAFKRERDALHAGLGAPGPPSPAEGGA